MKSVLLVAILVPLLVACGAGSHDPTPTQSSQAERSTYYLIRVKGTNGTPLKAGAMPLNFNLSDPSSRIFWANSSGCIRAPKDKALGGLKILCRGYVPLDLRVDQLDNDQNQIEVTLKEDPNQITGANHGQR